MSKKLFLSTKMGMVREGHVHKKHNTETFNRLGPFLATSKN
jgi:hypothetical protein